MKYKELVTATADRLYHEIRANTHSVSSFKSFADAKKMNPEKIKSAIMFTADAVLYEERNNYIRQHRTSSGFDSCHVEDDGTIVSESENIESKYREFKEYVIKEFDKHFK